MVAFVAKQKPKPSEFGLRLRAIRIARGLTQVQLGNAVGLLQNVVTRMETSPKANPTLETIMKFAAALNCTPNDLLVNPLPPTPGE